MNINRNTSHPSAFISSTFLDFKEERKAVAGILQEYNLNVNALDIKPASNNNSKKEILKGINESDFIILIVGHRYGSIIPEITGSKNHSITKWEYLQARLMRKDILVFFKEQTRENLVDNKVLLDEFKNNLSRTHNPKYFSTVSELEDEVRKALIPVYRAGVASLLSKQDQLKSENTRLSQENQKLIEEYSKKPDSGGISNINRALGLFNISPHAPTGLLGQSIGRKIDL
ncbi:DUF4062 domain-containing protein [Candidatus Methylomicrobium oryzae]|uniref:DUF4062 domain-containing protein n=1 Tax=Candidatus Methylomicrobium oryzae TaxID=2802053 RepID=UPI001924DF98|nr:DUF4062 domain-containing protein [Methylomicrobium sp. RS1]MBL1264052.1 DUF4062 domain-containing protein [Methylomicrobium sp. RS1]